MRLHTNLDENTIRGAARLAGAGLLRLSHFRSRSANHGWDVVLSGHGITGGQYGTLDGKTASWDEWGIFLAALYWRNPSARLGPYLHADHFTWSTMGRYEALSPADQHLRHKWRYDHHTAAYTAAECPCGAGRRALLPKRSWADVADAFEAEQQASVMGADSYEYGPDESDMTLSDVPAAEPWVPRQRQLT